MKIKRTNLLTYIAAAAVLAVCPTARSADFTVTTNISSNTTWVSTTDYILEKPIFVTNGATLTIEPGTNIYGAENVGDDTFGSLVITRGSKIEAVGTKDSPIVFTALDERDFGPLTLADSGLWGGLILLGEAILNDAGNPFLNGTIGPERIIEGFPSGGDESLITYGGLNDADDSGTLRYVSIRYGGYLFDTDNEINGLTLGAVGSGTDISFVEVFNNADDGIEFFGGTVDTKYMAMVFNEDESFDIDQGYRGRGQFWFAIGKPVGAGSNFGGEHDGGDSPNKILEPFARSKVFNATFIGAGAGASFDQDNGAFRLKDNFAGQYHNSVFHDFKDHAMRIDDQSTRDRANASGDLSFENNTWGSFGTDTGTVTSLTKNGSAEEIAQLNTKGNEIADPRLRGISRSAAGGLDPRPCIDSPLWTSDRSDLPENDEFFILTNFRGAFGDNNWLEEWTAVDGLGYLSDPAPVATTDVTVTANITVDTTWTKDMAYILEKPIFVTGGATLTIEPGTNIYGAENVGDDTFGSLVITRGSKIEAIGTCAEPIVFTALDERDFGPLTLTDSGLWGGLILLGEAILNDAGNPFLNGTIGPERIIEGFPSGGDESLITYGGLNDADDSGTLRYVSIRYGGYLFDTDNEINGLTLGAVGSGTDISFVEVFNNADDGIEFFGGTVDTKYMAMVFNEDESFDIDQGYRGRGQFWFAIGKPVGAGSNFGGEHDGGDSPNKILEPFARSKVFNATFIGAGAGASFDQDNGAFRLKDNFAGQYHNSVFHDFKDHAMRIDDQSTRDRANASGDLSFENNTWGSFGTDTGTVTSLTKNGSAEEIAQLNTKGNEIADPRLRGISRSAAGGFDPRPCIDSPLWTSDRSDLPENDEFFILTNFRGAFGDNNWLEEWTAVDGLGYLSDPAPVATTDVTVTANITVDTTWTKDMAYILEKPIFVTGGATLTIEPGTNIYGAENVGDDTFGSLVITRGSKIEAIGTCTEPIVFTALDERDFGPLTLTDSGLWGGLILLGEAILNDAGNPFLNGTIGPERIIEGFPSGGDESLITYGGLNDADDSGTLRYVSIRYGGYLFDTDNEINGLTLGAVGSGTDISFVEVFNNADDGIEFFGGTVDTKYMAMVFNEDESFDIDQGYRGRGQFWFAIGKPVGAGSNFGGEHDGGDSPNKILEPFARSKVFNATFIGAGAGASFDQDNGAFRLKDNFAGQYHNSVFHDFKDHAMRIDDQSTRDRANASGDLSFENNTWGSFGTDTGTVTSLTKNGSAEEIAQLNTKGNVVELPELVGISRLPDGGLDPRPQNGSPLFGSALSELPAGFYCPANYRGAFGATNWLRGWTQLEALGYLDDSTYIEEPEGSVDPPTGGYDNWALTALAGEAMNGRADDPNDDGLNNLGSFAFGVNPLTSAGRENLPTPDGETVVFTRSTDDSLTFTYEVSTDLSAWQTAVDGVDYTETISPNGDFETVTVTLLGSDLRKQFRIRVTD